MHCYFLSVIRVHCFGELIPMRDRTTYIEFDSGLFHVILSSS